jgi:hypothetical protein
MLHDPSHTTPYPLAEGIILNAKEKTVLRRLAEELAGIAMLPVHREKMGLWRRLNGLKQIRPMVWINEIPWHEMNVNNELSRL